MFQSDSPQILRHIYQSPETALKAVKVTELLW